MIAITERQVNQGIIAGLLACVAVTAGTNTAFADKNPKKSDQKKVQAEQRDVAEARDDLQELQKDLKEAGGRRIKSEAAQRTAAQHIKKVTGELEAKHEVSAGLTKARDAQKVAQEAFDTASAPVLAASKAKPEYQAAVDAAKAASARLKALREDKSLSDADRKKQTSESTQAVFRPSQLEQAALEADPAAKAAREKLTKAGEAVQAARKKVDAAVEKDPALIAAKADLEKAKKDIAAAVQEIERTQQKIAAAQQKLTRESQQLLQQKAQADKNKKKNKNGK